MSPKKITTAAATATAIAASMATIAPAAYAATPTPTPHSVTPNTFPGAPGALTITTGDDLLHFANGGTEPMPSQQVNDAEWAPDGSRVTYIDQNSNLVSVRNDGTDLVVVATGVSASAHPTFMNGGSLIVYAQGGNLYQVSSLGNTVPTVLAAGHQSGDQDAAPQGGPNGLLVFQRNRGGHTSIWVYNGYQNVAQGLNHLGFSPSISPDGKTIAFVLPDNSANPISQVWVIGRNGSSATQLTNNGLPAEQSDTPVWSPDGSQIAFALAGGTVTMPPTVGGAETPVASISGRLSWQPVANNLVERLWGEDRIGTAIEASQWSWTDWNAAPTGTRKQANVVVLAREDIFADALAGSALAASFKGPLLLTPTGELDGRTLAEIQRVLKPGGFVYILGETQAISAHTEAQVDAAGFLGSRLGGTDRFATAIDIAEKIVPTYTTTPVNILTATGMLYPDALAAGAVAGTWPNTVVVLTDDKVMPGNTLAFINSVQNKRVFGIGGEAVHALNSVNIPQTQVSGDDRFITATMVARTFFGGPQMVGIATGYNFPDALAGGALAGAAGGPLLLTGPTALPTSTADYLRSTSGSVSDAVMFGGHVVLDYGLNSQIGDLIGLPGHWTYTENDPGAHVGPEIAATK